MKVTVDGETVDAHVTVQLRWDPVLETIRERTPIKELLKSECIALNAAWMGRRARLDELDQLEATLQKPPVEPNRR